MVHSLARQEPKGRDGDQAPRQGLLSGPWSPFCSPF